LEIVNKKQIALFIRHVKNINRIPFYYYRLKYYKIHLITELLISSNITLNEILLIRREDIDFDKRVIKSVNRNIEISNYIGEILKIYTDLIHKSSTGVIFNFDSKFATKLNSIFKKCSAKAGIPLLTLEYIESLPVCVKKGFNREF